MSTRVTAVRALAGVALGLAVVAGLVLVARPAGQRTARGAAGSRAPAGIGAQPAATSVPGPRVPGAATATTAGPPPGRPAQAAPDPCRLATRAEVAAVLGRPVTRIQRRQGFLVRACLFSGADAGRQVVVQVNEGPAASREQFAMARTIGSQPVRGVGDEAWFTPDTGLLDVRDGVARFQVGLLDATGPSRPGHVPSSLLALARKVAGRVG
ncbi:MAG TPA: hypothetical protein VF486_15935 [Actinomycetes bacterium]|jgi:hypothetical protein